MTRSKVSHHKQLHKKSQKINKYELYQHYYLHADDEEAEFGDKIHIVKKLHNINQLYVNVKDDVKLDDTTETTPKNCENRRNY